MSTADATPSPPSGSTPAVDHGALPYRIAVLCYLYDADGRVLMLHRRKSPNAGMYSPIGGKLEVGIGEGPHECAVREIHEEAGISLAREDVHMSGIVSEAAYQNETHWLIFLFEVTRPIDPSEIEHMDFDEGALEWVDPARVLDLNIPATDREVMWPMVQRHRGGFFVAHIDCSKTPFDWKLEESKPLAD